MKLLDGTELNFKNSDEIIMNKIEMSSRYSDEEKTIFNGLKLWHYFHKKEKPEDSYILEMTFSKEDVESKIEKNEKDQLLSEEDRGYGWLNWRKIKEFLFLLVKFDFGPIAGIKIYPYKEEDEKITPIEDGAAKEEVSI